MAVRLVWLSAVVTKRVLMCLVQDSLGVAQIIHVAQAVVVGLPGKGFVSRMAVGTLHACLVTCHIHRQELTRYLLQCIWGVSRRVNGV